MAAQERPARTPAGEVTAPDTDAPAAAPAPTPATRPRVDTLAVIALGGALGALARHGAGRLWPTPPGAFPWATFSVNVVGCALIGVLMVIITHVHTAPRLVRPFLGVGVLGGFTTFSTYAVEALDLALAARPGRAVGYLLVTVLAAVTAVAVAARLTGGLWKLYRRLRTRGSDATASGAAGPARDRRSR